MTRLRSDEAEAFREILLAAPGMQGPLEQVEVFAPRSRPLLLLGELTTSRALLSRLLALTGPVYLTEINCREMNGQKRHRGLLQALLPHKERLMKPGVLALLEVDAIDAQDANYLSAMLRQGCFDLHGSQIAARLVCHFEPRNGGVSLPREHCLQVPVPSLSERSGDAAWLLERLIQRRLGNLHRIDPAARPAIEKHTWPGDVSELAAVVERLEAEKAVGGLPPLLSATNLGVPMTGAPRIHAQSSATAGRSLREIMAEYEAEVVRIALERAGGNRSQAARDLEISRSYLIQKCRDYNIT